MFPKFIISFPSNCFANNISLMMRNNNDNKTLFTPSKVPMVIIVLVSEGKLGMEEKIFTIIISSVAYC